MAAVEHLKREKWQTFRDRRGGWDRDLALYVGRKLGGWKLSELGEAAGDLDYRSVAGAVRRFGERLKNDVEMQERLEAIKNEIENEKT